MLNASHPLQRKIASLRRRTRSAEAARGVCNVVAVMLCAIAALATIDYLLQIHDRGIRIIFSLSMLSALAWTLYHSVGGWIAARREETDYARLVEQVFPSLRNRLVSAMQFLRSPDDDPTAGSPTLRRAVIESVETDAAALDFTSVVDYRRAIRSAILALTACLLAFVAILYAPDVSWTAAVRLANPLGEERWPEENSLRTVLPIEPPALESLSIRLIPPAYTGLPPTDSGRYIRGRRGTRVFMTGRADRPLAAASVQLEGGTKIPARLGQDKITFSIGDISPFKIGRSESYRIELTGRDGAISESESWSIQTVADAPPSIAIERPAADLFVTPSATVPVRVTADDDLAVVRIELVFQTDATGDLRWETIFEASGQTASNDGNRTIDYRWRLAPLDLPPGTVVTYSAAAEDGLGQSVDSATRRLTVVSGEELLARIADRLKLIAAELARARGMQAGCLAKTEAVLAAERHARQSRQTNVDDIQTDNLQTVCYSQREIRRLLAEDGGISSQVRALSVDVANNHIDNRPLDRGLAALTVELDQLDRERLAAVVRELAAATKSVRLVGEGQGSERRKIADSLGEVADHQRAIIVSLDKMMELTGRTDAGGAFYIKLAMMLGRQQKVAERTTLLGRRTLARRLHELSLQEVGELSETADEQAELARRVGRLLQSAKQEDDLSHRMYAAADCIRLNRVGLATAAQKRIARTMKEILAAGSEAGPADASNASSRGEDIEIDAEGDKRGKPTDSSGGADRASETPGNAAESKTPAVESDDRQISPASLRIWGELPAEAREALPPAMADDVPPGYERTIEEYFRRLADHDREINEKAE